MTRRDFLALTCALALTSRVRSEESRVRLIRTDPGCPPGAFDDTNAYFRKMRENEQPITQEKRLADGRAWLAGPTDVELKPGEEAYWMDVPNDRGPEVQVRVLRPPGELKGVMLGIHGGGWVMGTARSDEKRHWETARRCGVAVLSPEYRLAPEHPFPAAPDDCEAVARWLRDNSEREFGTRQRAIWGASAGSHLAALTLQRVPRDTFRCVVLYYGVYDLGRSRVWRHSTSKEFPDLTPEDMNLYLEWFVPGLSDEKRRSPTYSPLFGDLKGMPPALFLVGSADLLAHDTYQMAERWAEEGSPAELVVYPGGPHGFDGFGVDCGLDPGAYAAKFISRHL